jgi:hypothetical protein
MSYYTWFIDNASCLNIYLFSDRAPPRIVKQYYCGTDFTADYTDGCLTFKGSLGSVRVQFEGKDVHMEIIDNPRIHTWF